MTRLAIVNIRGANQNSQIAIDTILLFKENILITFNLILKKIIWASTVKMKNTVLIMYTQLLAYANDIDVKWRNEFANSLFVYQNPFARNVPPSLPPLPGQKMLVNKTITFLVLMYSSKASRTKLWTLSSQFRQPRLRRTPEEPSRNSYWAFTAKHLWYQSMF